jgi:hypothetical protein
MSSIRRLWSRLPPKSRVLFALATALVCVGAGLLGEELYFRANAIRVEGTVVGHDRKGRPIVEYEWGGQSRRYETRGPNDSLAVGTAIGVYVPTDGPLAQAPLDFSRGRSRGGNAHCERRSTVRWGPGRNDSLSGRSDRRPRLEARDERGHLGIPPAGRRPALRWERCRQHDRSSCRTAKAIAGADRDGCAALFASGADRRCALSGHREPVVPHRGKALILNALRASISGG